MHFQTGNNPLSLMISLFYLSSSWKGRKESYVIGVYSIDEKDILENCVRTLPIAIQLNSTNEKDDDF